MLNIRFIIVPIVLAAGVPAQAQLFNRNLVVNGGAESGPGALTPADSQISPPGWTVSGKLSVANYGGSYFLSPSDFGPPPLDRGSRFFYGGASTQRSSATQTIDLSAAASDIDNSRIRFTLSGYLGFLNNTAESIETTNLKVEFLDASGAVLLTSIAGGPQVADVVNLSAGLFFRSATGYLLPNTRAARVTIDLAFESTYYFAADNVSLSLAADPLYGVNQVVNGDAETPFPGALPADANPGWNANSTCTARNYGGPSLPALTDTIPPEHGQNLLFCPSPKTAATAYQMVDITAAKSAVDGGKVSYVLSAWLGGPGDTPDNAAITVTFYDGTSQQNSLGNVSLGPVTQQNLGARIGLQQQSVPGFVPVGTRKIKTAVTFNRLRTDSQPGMGLADNISLVLNAANITSVVNAASSQPGPVAPGEFVSLYGSGLGPATGLKSTAGLQKGLVGAKVTFNGIEAYLDYVSATQINALVPYGVSGKADAVVQYGGQQTDPFPLAVADSSTGIFTQQYGVGQSWVVNQDNSFNSAQKAAAPGSYIAFWATGQGAVTPAGVDGEIVNGYKTLALPVKVTIGGLDASVAFAGLIYTGEIQVNAVVPANSPGGNLDLQLTIGTNTSRLGATISIAGPTGAAPQLTGIATVSSPPIHGIPFNFTVNGSNFNPAIAIVSFSGPGCATACSAGSLTGSLTQLSGILSLPAGTYSVSVRNGSNGAPSNKMTLAVSTPSPSIASMTTVPNPPASGQAFTFSISGNNFDPSTAIVAFSGPGCAVPCTVSGLTGSPTQLNGTTTLPTGVYSVTTRNGAAGTASNAVQLAVSVSVPTIASITSSPNPPINGQIFTFTLAGVNFDPTTARALFTGPGCTPCTVTGLTGSATQLSGSTTLSAGTFAATVQSGTNGASSKPVSLTVVEATPILNAITTSPNPPVNGQSFNFTIAGSRFNPANAIVSFSGTGCSPCTAFNLTGSAAQLSGTVMLSGAGAYTVTVRNAATGAVSNALSVTVGSSAPSLISSITTSPNPPVNGTSFNFTVSGSNFNPATAIVTFTGPGCAAGCNASGVYGSASQLNGTATLSSGSFTVMLRNGAAGASTNSVPLTVSSGTGSTPQLTGITTPNPPASGQPFSFTITGSNFVPASAIAYFSGPGCSSPCAVGSLTGSATQLTGSSMGLTGAGSYTLTVRNGAGGTASNGLTLTVSTGIAGTPQLTGITPSPDPPINGQPFSFTVSGTNFDPSTAIVSFSGAGCNTPCTVPSLTGSSTQLSGSLPLPTGAYTVTVRNGSNGTASNGLLLTVSTGIGPTSQLTAIIAVPNPPAASGPFTFAITGTNFNPTTATVYFTGPGCLTGCPVSNLTRTATELDGAMLLSSGTFTVTVRNDTNSPVSNGLSLTVK